MNGLNDFVYFQIDREKVIIVDVFQFVSILQSPLIIDYLYFPNYYQHLPILPIMPFFRHFDLICWARRLIAILARAKKTGKNPARVAAPRHVIVFDVDFLTL